jgi:DNA-binding transcriptional MerR regulator
MSARRPKSATAFRSIGEAALELELPAHVLRFWESRFPTKITPVKRPDGRRMFRPEDIEALRAVKLLVHERGMTLKGAERVLREQGVAAVLEGTAMVVAARPQAEDSVRARDAVERLSALVQTASEGAVFTDAARLAAANPTVAADTGARLSQALDRLRHLQARLHTARQPEARLSA